MTTEFALINTMNQNCKLPLPQVSIAVKVYRDHNNFLKVSIELGLAQSFRVQLITIMAQNMTADRQTCCWTSSLVVWIFRQQEERASELGLGFETLKPSLSNTLLLTRPHLLQQCHTSKHLTKRRDTRIDNLRCFVLSKCSMLGPY